MNDVARSIKAFGVLAIVSGLPMVLAPHVVLALVGVPTADDVWVRLWGMEVVVLGFYYVAAARANARPFFTATVWGRLTFAAVLVGLVLLIAAPWQILIVGSLDSAGALWTLAALRGERPAERS